jgi:hypothetical protein
MYGYKDKMDRKGTAPLTGLDSAGDSPRSSVDGGAPSEDGAHDLEEDIEVRPSTITSWHHSWHYFGITICSIPSCSTPYSHV